MKQTQEIALAKIYSGQRDQLTAEEYVALEHELSIFLPVFENNHFQYEMEFLPEDHWQKNLKDIDCRMTEPFFSTIAEFWNARAEGSGLYWTLPSIPQHRLFCFCQARPSSVFLHQQLPPSS